MKLEKKILKNHQCDITVEVEQDQFDQYKIIAARNISRESKIPGFRPGKAPYDVILRIYGEDLIEDRAVEELVNQIYPEIISETGIKPYGPGKLEEIISKNPPKYKFIIPLEPEVDIKDYYSIRLAYKLPKVQKKETDQVVLDLQTNYATAEDVTRSSQDGDLVTVKINAILQKPTQDEKPGILQDTPHQVILGNHKDEEQFPYKGFMDQLLSLKVGEEKAFNYKYPKESQYENLQGKTVDFSVIVESIKKLSKPELNDEFAKLVGIDSFEHLIQSVTDQLEAAKRNEYENEYFNNLLDKLINQATIKYPPQMLESELADVIKNFEKNLAQQNLDLDTYLKINTREKDDFISSDLAPAAKKRLEQALVLEEFSRLEKIEIDQKELQKEYSKSFIQLQSSPDYKKIQKQTTTKIMSEAMIMQAANRIIHQNSLDQLKKIANGELKKSTEKENTPAATVKKPEAEKDDSKDAKESSNPE